jgi:hypothetical protein
MLGHMRERWAAATVRLFVVIGLCGALGLTGIARTWAEGEGEAEVRGLLVAYGLAIEQEALDAIIALHWNPDELKRDLRARWAPVFDQYDDLQAGHEVLLYGSRGGRALVRYRYKVTGVKARSRDAQRYVLLSGTWDTLAAKTDAGWRLTGSDWPQPDVKGEIHQVLAAARKLPAPNVLQLVFALHGGQWHPVRPFVWYGALQQSTEASGSGGGRTEWPKGEEAAVWAMLDAWAKKGEPGTLAVFMQASPSAAADKAEDRAPVDPVWTPAPKTDDEADRSLAAARKRMEEAFGSADAHEAYGQALLAAGDARAAFEEQEKACMLAPTEERRAAVEQTGRALSADAAEREWQLETDARRTARLMAEQVRVEQDRSGVAVYKPPSVLLNDAFVLRFRPGDPTATLAMAALEEAHRRVTALFGVPMRPVDVSIFASKAEYLAFRRIRGENWVPEWSGGTSGVDGILTFSQPQVRRTMLHEYGHEAVKQFASDAPVPYWLNEGIATAIEGVPENCAEIVRQMATSGRAFDIEQLTGTWAQLPTNEASLAYAQSRSMVEFLLHKVGRDRFLGILAGLRSGAPYEAVFQQCTGVSQADFGRLWLAEVLRQGEGGGAPNTRPR